ncbi:hypothetical protein KHQ81_06195 [Mycoplasmatota bacterium]|nr:hypothetical protein KHQ81_06195 [Mycoplasmatota bacterium]
MFKERKENHKIRKEDVDYYIEQAKTLALTYEEQYKQLSNLDDYITNDIASDWIWNDLKSGVILMYTQSLISDTVITLYKEINKNFYDVSIDGSFYDENFWTLNGLKNHPLWEEQRQLARRILKILKKIDL